MFAFAEQSDGHQMVFAFAEQSDGHQMVFAFAEEKQLMDTRWCLFLQKKNN